MRWLGVVCCLTGPNLFSTQEGTTNVPAATYVAMTQSTVASNACAIPQSGKETTRVKMRQIPRRDAQNFRLCCLFGHQMA